MTCRAKKWRRRGSRVPHLHRHAVVVSGERLMLLFRRGCNGRQAAIAATPASGEPRDEVMDASEHRSNRRRPAPGLAMCSTTFMGATRHSVGCPAGIRASHRRQLPIGACVAVSGGNGAGTRIQPDPGRTPDLQGLSRDSLRHSPRFSFSEANRDMISPCTLSFCTAARHRIGTSTGCPRVPKACLVIVCGLLAGRLAVASAAREPSRKTEDQVQWVTPAVRAPHLQHRVFFSAAAKSKVSFHIYTPEAYDRDKTLRFPVIYWLHGHGGGLRGLPKLVPYFDRAMAARKMPPALIVFPNGLAEGMWCDSKDGRTPVETIVVKELVPYVDANFRTIASREGRLVEGFSMGGYGAARLGLKYSDIFGAASILGAGPMQRRFTPAKGPPEKAGARARILRKVYGGDQEYFKAQSPWELAEQYADEVRGRLRLRVAVGDRDAMLRANEAFSQHLSELKIPHTFRVVRGAGHNPSALFDALGDDTRTFYRQVFGALSRPSAKPELKK